VARISSSSTASRRSRALQSIVSGSGFEPTLAATGEEALEVHD